MYSYKIKDDVYVITFNDKIIYKYKQKKTMLNKLMKLIHNEFNDMLQDAFTNHNDYIVELNNTIAILTKKHDNLHK